MNTTSVSLLQRLREPGEQAAWARFVQLYTPLLYYWARRLGEQEPDAADLVQEVFVVLVEKLPEFTYDRHRSFRNWLRTVLLNKWRARGRRKGRLPPQAGGVETLDLPGPGEDEAFGESEYRQHLTRRVLELMQGEFQPNTWKACWEQVVSGRPAAEVGAELGMSEGAVYVAKSRVLRRLRQELEGLLE